MENVPKISKIKFYFKIILDLQENFVDSTETSYIHQI